MITTVKELLEKTYEILDNQPDLANGVYYNDDDKCYCTVGAMIHVIEPKAQMVLASYTMQMVPHKFSDYLNNPLLNEAVIAMEFSSVADVMAANDYSFSRNQMLDRIKKGINKYD